MLEVHNSVNSPHVLQMVEMLYEGLQRRGYLRRDIERMVNRDRNIFGSLLLKLGLGDAMITGVTRTYSQTMREVRRVIDFAEGKTAFGIHVLVGQHHTIFMADTTVNERPRPKCSPTSPTARRRSHAAWVTNRALPSCPIRLPQPAGIAARQYPRCRPHPRRSPAGLRI